MSFQLLINTTDRTARLVVQTIPLSGLFRGRRIGGRGRGCGCFFLLATRQQHGANQGQ